MAERVRLADGTELDMLDPTAIRSYVRRTLATNVEPSPQSLQRLKMLLEVADSLPQPETKEPGAASVVKLVDAKRAVEVLRRRVVSGGDDGEK
jgi:hypothetical protein